MSKRLCILAILALLISGIPVPATTGENYRDAQIEGTFEVRSLEEVQEFADDLVNKETEVVTNFAEMADNFRQKLERLGAEVADAVNRWITEPTAENEALLSQKVQQAAKHGRMAAIQLASIRDNVSKSTLMLHDGVQTQLAETQQAARTARGRAERLTAELQKIVDTALEAKTVVAANGWAESGEIPEEWEDRLFELRLNFQEIEILTEIWSDVAAMLLEYEEVLKQADRDLDHIDSMAGRVADMAESVGRIFGHVGQAEVLKLRAKLTADAYARLGDLRLKISDALTRMQGMRGDLLRVVAAPRRIPSFPSRQQEPEPRRSDDLIAWIMSLNPKNTQIAQTQMEDNR